MRCVRGTLLGIVTAAVCYVVLDGGWVPGIVGLGALLALLVLTPTARGCSRRVALNGAFLIGWLPAPLVGGVARRPRPRCCRRLPGGGRAGAPGGRLTDARTPRRRTAPAVAARGPRAAPGRWGGARRDVAVGCGRDAPAGAAHPAPGRGQRCALPDLRGDEGRRCRAGGARPGTGRLVLVARRPTRPPSTRWCPPSRSCSRPHLTPGPGTLTAYTHGVAARRRPRHPGPGRRRGVPAPAGQPPRARRPGRHPHVHGVPVGTGPEGAGGRVRPVLARDGGDGGRPAAEHRPGAPFTRGCGSPPSVG